jgi:phage terminase large subunit
VQGLDFGYTNDPSSFNQSYVDHDNKIIYVYDGFYEKGLSNASIADKIKDMNAHKRMTTADSSEPKSIDYIKGKGVKVKGALKGPDSIKTGIDFLLEYTIIVNTHLVEFMTEFNNYCWAVNKDGKQLNKPVDDFNHFIDSLRYAMEDQFRPRGSSVYVPSRKRSR